MTDEEIDLLRKWLLQQPRPHSVRVTKLDGGVDEVLCSGPWTKVADTIEALQPEHLQALNEQKQTIRALRCDDIGGDWGSGELGERPSRKAAKPPETELPAIPAAAMDPESARFLLFARIMADQYKLTTQIAFQTLSDIVASTERSREGVERAKELFYRSQIKLLEDQLKQAQQEPEPEPQGDIGSQIVGSVLGGIMQGQAAKAEAAAHASNGKGQA